MSKEDIHQIAEEVSETTVSKTFTVLGIDITNAGISGQPSGTSMKWKVETLNAKVLRLHGVALEWS